MVSSHVCNVSIPELVKTTHVIDKLSSGQSTVLTRGGGEGAGGGTPYLSRKKAILFTETSNIMVQKRVFSLYVTQKGVYATSGL